jgi:hypothetical protein
MGRMQVVSTDGLGRALAALPGEPRVVASGNFAAPLRVLAVLDEALPAYRLHMLNAQPGIPDRAGVRYETALPGPAMHAIHGGRPS